MNHEIWDWLMASQTCFVVSATDGSKRGCASADDTLALPLLSSTSRSILMTTSALSGFGVEVSDLDSDIVSVCNTGCIDLEKIFSENGGLSNQTRKYNNLIVTKYLRNNDRYDVTGGPGIMALGHNNPGEFVILVAPKMLLE